MPENLKSQALYDDLFPSVTTTTTSYVPSDLGFDSTTRALRDICGEENMLTDYHDGYIDQIINHQKNMGDERPKTFYTHSKKWRIFSKS